MDYDRILIFLRNYIKDKKVSAASIAKKSGLTEATISRFIHKNNDPQFGTVAAIGKAIGLSLTDLILESNPELYGKGYKLVAGEEATENILTAAESNAKVLMETIKNLNSQIDQLKQTSAQSQKVQDAHTELLISEPTNAKVLRESLKDLADVLPVGELRALLLAVSPDTIQKARAQKKKSG